MNKKDWIWMPHPGHLIVSRDCRFHLNTYIGEYIVSTVGEYLPDSQIREINAKHRGIELEGIGDARLTDYMKKYGYEDIGFKRLYETMVFESEKDNESGCCPYKAKDWQEKDMDAYNSAEDAFKGHMKMCLKWENKCQST